MSPLRVSSRLVLLLFHGGARGLPSPHEVDQHPSGYARHQNRRDDKSPDHPHDLQPRQHGADDQGCLEGREDDVQGSLSAEGFEAVEDPHEDGVEAVGQDDPARDAHEPGQREVVEEEGDLVCPRHVGDAQRDTDHPLKGGGSARDLAGVFGTLAHQLGDRLDRARYDDHVHQ